MRILIAEDNCNFGLILKRELEDRGYAVDLVHDGVSAVKSFSELRHNAVLLDIRMPELNGIEALRIIREIEPKTLAITFSGNANTEEKQNALNAGAIASLDKPFSIDSLVGYLSDGIPHSNK